MTAQFGALRYRVLHVAARITHTALTTSLAIDHTWRWAKDITAAYRCLRDAFA